MGGWDLGGRAGLAAAVLAAATVPASAEPRSGTPLRELSEGLMAISVRLDDQAVELLLDTGSSATVLRPGVARRLGLRPVDRTLLTTLDGTRAVPRARLESLEVAGARTPGVVVVIAEIAGLAEAGPRLGGILGEDVLSRFDVLIDYEERTLLLAPSGALASALRGTAVPFAATGRTPLIAAAAESGTPELRLLLDSGSSGLVLFEPGAPASDRVAVRSRRLAELHVGGQRLRSLQAALWPGRGGRGEDGLLATSLFSRVYLSYRDRFAMLNPEPVAAPRTMAMAPASE